MEDTGGWAWSLATIAGPILLGLAILYGFLHSRGGRPRSGDRRIDPEAPATPGNMAPKRDPVDTGKYILRLAIPVVAAVLLIAVVMGVYMG